MIKEFSLIPDSRNLKCSLELAQQYGMAFEYNDFYLPAVLENEGLRAELIEKYRNCERDTSKDTLHGAFLDVILHSEDPQIRAVSEKRVRQSMETARSLGVKGVVFHTGLIGGFYEESYLKNWCDRSEAFYRKMLSEYPEIDIYVENMFDTRPDELVKLAKRMKDCENFGICLDYAHEVLFGDRHELWMKCLSPYIRHMHINDNFLTEDEHLPLGKGRINWKDFYKACETYRIEASVLIEVRGISEQKQSIEYLEKQGLLEGREEKQGKL